MSSEKSKPIESANKTAMGQLLESRVTIFALLFLVMAVLGLPLLWMSPRFKTWEKIFWSIVIVIYTAILVAITVAICWWSYTVITNSMA